MKKLPDGTFELRGNPTLYKPEFAQKARKLAKLGAIDNDLAEQFDVSPQTIKTWKHSQPAFNEALKAGKMDKDSMVVKSLHDRATGYTHKAVKIFCDPKTGVTTKVEYDEHYPPDPTSMIFWLKNRQPKEWRNDQQQINQVILTGSDIDIVKAIREAAAMLTNTNSVDIPASTVVDIESDCSSVNKAVETPADNGLKNKLVE